MYDCTRDTLNINLQFCNRNNKAVDRGAAIYVDYGVNVVISQSTFAKNIARKGHGGAIYVTDRSSNSDTTSVAISNSDFTSNSASGYGGAIFLYYGCFADLLSNTFTSNDAGLAGGGIALYNAYTENVTDLNTFANNTAPKDANVYTDTFPHFGRVVNKISDFTSYLNRLSQYYDTSTEPDTRGTVIYVDGSESQSGDGKSWDDAVLTIDQALTIVEQIGSKDCEIWVRGGSINGIDIIYYPTSVPDWYDKTAQYYDPVKSMLIDLTENVIIFGGFGGIETKRSQRNFTKYPTRISGQLPGTTDPEHETYQVINMGQNTRLDGFIISDGQGVQTQSLEDMDTVGNVNIKKKYSTNNNKNNNKNNVGTSSSESEQLHSKVPQRGNGIFANASGIEIANVLVVNNYGAIGAGLIVLYHDVVGNNVGFVNNVAESRGGAVMIEVTAEFNCTNCFFEDNISAKKAGAVYLDYNGDMTLSGDNCYFGKNVAYDGGGAIALDGSSGVNLMCRNTTFANNECFQDGPAIYEGSYGYQVGAEPNELIVGKDVNLSMVGNVPFNETGSGSYFIWNFDSVTLE